MGGRWGTWARSSVRVQVPHRTPLCPHTPTAAPVRGNQVGTCIVMKQILL